MSEVSREDRPLVFVNIKNISTSNFRNLSSSVLEFDKGVNIFYGDNGNGKTNILEAIWLLSGGKSFRGSRDREMIKFGEKRFKIEGKAGQRDRDRVSEDFFCDYSLFYDGGEKYQGRVISVDGSRYEPAIERAGDLARVAFSPTHMSIVTGSPGDRRRYLDGRISQYRRLYVDNFRKYSRRLNQRNSFLKTRKAENMTVDDAAPVLEAMDEVISRVGFELIKERKNYFEYLNRYALPFFSRISGGRDEIAFKYNTAANSRDEYFEKLRGDRERDIFFGSTTHGPHRDELEIMINSKPAKDYASQGQQRSAVLAMKLAECRVLTKINGCSPFVLLDDVLSELDRKRQDYILNNIRDRQIFITTCHLERVRLSGGKKFRVENGEVF